MLNKINRAFKFLINYALSTVIKSPKGIQKKTLLIIRLDAIGDYVLFRNFLDILKKDPRYKEYKFTLLGNTAWKDIAYEYDSTYIDEFIWLDRNLFITDFTYRYKKLKQISVNGYEIALSPVYSRNFLVEDLIIKCINATHKIGHVCDLSNIKTWQKKISDTYYTKLIQTQDDIVFEFYRNKMFFETLLNKKITIPKPDLSVPSVKTDIKLPNKYAMLFIGASADYRKWDIRNFAEVGQVLKDKYNYEIVLCGAHNDIKSAQLFRKYFQYSYLDLVGKTSLIELLYVISKADILLSNETSIPHFAVTLNVKNIFVVSNGNHFLRFTPYPKDIYQNYHVVFHPQIEKSIDNTYQLKNLYGSGSTLNINDITVRDVVYKLDKVFATNLNEKQL